MAALLRGSSTIRTSVCADIFDANTNAAHQNEEASGNGGDNYGSSAVMSTPPCAGISKVATATPKISILFNNLVDIKVGFFVDFNLYIAKWIILRPLVTIP